jgi:hypothetical protein
VRQLDVAPSGRCWSGFGLTLTVTKSDSLRANVRLAGDLDLASAQILAAALEHELELTGTDSVLLVAADHAQMSMPVA